MKKRSHGIVLNQKLNHSGVASHVDNTMEERSALGIPENMIRCSVGIENIDDIKRDFLQALESL